MLGSLGFLGVWGVGFRAWGLEFRYCAALGDLAAFFGVFEGFPQLC